MKPGKLIRNRDELEKRLPKFRKRLRSVMRNNIRLTDSNRGSGKGNSVRKIQERAQNPEAATASDEGYQGLQAKAPVQCTETLYEVSYR